MNTEAHTLAARFIFNNCTVSIIDSGEVLVGTRPASPDTGEVLIDRDFKYEQDPSEYCSKKSDFFRFLQLTSSAWSPASLKIHAIGCMLCNKLPRRRGRRFGCLFFNGEPGATRNGKSLFATAISQFCTTVKDSPQMQGRYSFYNSCVTERTTLLFVDDLPSYESILNLYTLTMGDWQIARKCEDLLTIKHENAPYVIAATNLCWRDFGEEPTTFIPVGFSSFFGPDRRPVDYFGHSLFYDWDAEQWHLFDNFMIYCVTEYLKALDGGTINITQS